MKRVSWGAKLKRVFASRVELCWNWPVGHVLPAHQSLSLSVFSPFVVCTSHPLTHSIALKRKEAFHCACENRVSFLLIFINWATGSSQRDFRALIIRSSQLCKPLHNPLPDLQYSPLGRSLDHDYLMAGYWLHRLSHFSRSQTLFCRDYLKPIHFPLCENLSCFMPRAAERISKIIRLMWRLYPFPMYMD